MSLFECSFVFSLSVAYETNVPNRRRLGRETRIHPALDLKVHCTEVVTPGVRVCVVCLLNSSEIVKLSVCGTHGV